MTSSKALIRYLEPVTKLLEQDGVTEVLINRPGEVFVECYGRMEKKTLDAYDYQYLLQLSNLVASYNGQHINETAPLLSATLPGGERIQIVRPPACSTGTVAMAIRKPCVLEFDLDDYQYQGAFDNVSFECQSLSDQDRHLIDLKRQWNIKAFIRHAVRYRKNIIISGGTSSGKTTFLNAIVKEIPPHERIITIEDVQEAKLPHENKVHLLYCKGGQGTARVTATDLLEVCLRLRPDRILPAEIRGEEAFAFLECINSGHPGSMTTIHADSARQAQNRLVFMCLRAKSGLSKEQLIDYINTVVDVIIQFKRQNGKRIVTDIQYEPQKN
jgi:type IV secretion system protein VirB11